MNSFKGTIILYIFCFFFVCTAQAQLEETTAQDLTKSAVNSIGKKYDFQYVTESDFDVRPFFNYQSPKFTINSSYFNKALDLVNSQSEWLDKWRFFGLKIRKNEANAYKVSGVDVYLLGDHFVASYEKLEAAEEMHVGTLQWRINW